MKTILIITDNLPDQINGVVTTYKNIETYAVRDGYRIVYITPGNFRYFNCPGYNEVKITYPRKIGQKIEAIRPDYIHIATEGPVGLCARKYLSKRGYCYNTAYHTKFPEGLRALFGIPETLTWPLIRWFHSHSGKILTTTDAMVKHLREHGFTGELISWTRGVDTSIFNSQQRSRKNTKPLLVCVSRVSKEKNLEDFFKLDYPNSHKIMVGDGPMLDTYRKQYPSVEFVGFKTGHNLAYYYANADVFVFPSRWETFGIVMIEAMACGTPIAAYPCQGPKDIITEGMSGYMDENLYTSVDKCLKLSRDIVLEKSKEWSWEKAWRIFRDNLIEGKIYGSANTNGYGNSCI
jgi:glycosyltransferase involved in cell wall biosynthesis